MNNQTIEAIATEVARRFDAGEALGRPSIYNIVREVLYEMVEIIEEK